MSENRIGGPPWDQPGADPVGDLRAWATPPDDEALRRVSQLATDFARNLAEVTLLPDEPPEYDPDEGRVVLSRWIDGAVREAILVRRELEEQTTRRAVIAELECLGYTITPPTGGSAA